MHVHLGWCEDYGDYEYLHPPTDVNQNVNSDYLLEVEFGMF